MHGRVTAGEVLVIIPLTLGTAKDSTSRYIAILPIAA